MYLFGGVALLITGVSLWLYTISTESTTPETTQTSSSSSSQTGSAPVVQSSSANTTPVSSSQSASSGPPVANAWLALPQTIQTGGLVVDGPHNTAAYESNDSWGIGLSEVVPNRPSFVAYASYDQKTWYSFYIDAGGVSVSSDGSEFLVEGTFWVNSHDVVGSIGNFAWGTAWNNPPKYISAVYVVIVDTANNMRTPSLSAGLNYYNP